MKTDGRTRNLITAALAALVGLALGAAPAATQQTDAQAGAAAPAQEQPRQIKVRILGMSCPFCAYGVEQKLKRLDGVKELEVELESGVATLTMEEGADVANEQLRKVIDDAGFEADAVARTFESEHEEWNPERLPGEEGSGTEGSGTEGSGT